MGPEKCIVSRWASADHGQAVSIRMSNRYPCFPPIDCALIIHGESRTPSQIGADVTLPGDSETGGRPCGLFPARRDAPRIQSVMVSVRVAFTRGEAAGRGNGQGDGVGRWRPGRSLCPKVPGVGAGPSVRGAFCGISGDVDGPRNTVLAPKEVVGLRGKSNFLRKKR